VEQGNALKPPGLFLSVQPVQQNIGDTSAKQLSVNGIGGGPKELLHEKGFSGRTAKGPKAGPFSVISVCSSLISSN